MNVAPDAGRFHYDLMAAALRYIETRRDEQPTLEEVAAAIGLSPTHFQRVFSQWVGVSPKRYLQHLTLDHAKRLLDGTTRRKLDDDEVDDHHAEQRRQNQQQTPQNVATHYLNPVRKFTPVNFLRRFSSKNGWASMPSTNAVSECCAWTGTS